jgi:hypothetical protein
MAMNPLMKSAQSPARQMQKEHPAMGHAKAWQAVQQIPPDELAEKTRRLDKTLPMLGALASDPKVTFRKAVKAASQAAADHDIPAAEVVKFISALPTEEAKLGPFLRDLYAMNMSGLVHMKAAMMVRDGGQQMEQPMGAQPQMAQPQQPMQPPAMPMPGGQR